MARGDAPVLPRESQQDPRVPRYPRRIRREANNLDNPNVVVKLLKDFRIFGIDREKGEIVSVPKPTAEVLIRDGHAIKI